MTPISRPKVLPIIVRTMFDNRYLQCLIAFLLITLSMLLSESINCVVSIVGRTLIVFLISWKLIESLNRHLGRKRLISSSGKAVIISGCDSGFGNELAVRLNRLGFFTIATCLDVNSDGAKQLKRRAVFPDRLLTIQVDVTKDSQIDHTFSLIADTLRDNGLQLWALINNAGVFHIGFVEWGHQITGYERTLDVNTLGTVRMTRKYLPLLRASGGRVVNVLSGASHLALEGVSAYSVSKFAALAFNDSLRREVFRFGVKVISVEPSCYRTPISDEKSVSALLDKVWSETPKDIRRDYGTDFFEWFKSWYGKQAERARDPFEVVSALTEAVTSGSPQTRYCCCGPLVAIIWSMAELLPTQLFDDIWRIISQLKVITE